MREEQDKQREHDRIQQEKTKKFRLAQMWREKERDNVNEKSKTSREKCQTSRYVK